jgi:hypothetical protein
MDEHSSVITGNLDSLNNSLYERGNNLNWENKKIICVKHIFESLSPYVSYFFHSQFLVK